MADRSALNLLERELQALAPPSESGAVLCLGLGGGSDALTAYLVARLLERHGARDVHYGNTRGRFDEPVVCLSARVGRFEGPREPLVRSPRHGSTDIDRSVPRGPGGSPLVVLLDKESLAEAPAQLAPELDARGYQLIVGVDTGGDVLSSRRPERNRDRVMLRVLQATRAEVLGVVLALGSDGSRPEPLVQALEEMGPDYLGCFSLEPWAGLLEELSLGLPNTRTPRLILQALASAARELEIPRGARPRVPRELLCHGFVFRMGTCGMPSSTYSSPTISKPNEP